MPGDDKLYRGIAQALDHVEIFLARDGKDTIDALVLQRGDHQVRPFWHLTFS
jgi:hypothetical protein